MPSPLNNKTLVQVLNDRGAESLLKGSYSDALSLFRQGLGIVRGLPSSEEGQQETSVLQHEKRSHSVTPRFSAPISPSARKVTEHHSIPRTTGGHCNGPLIVTTTTEDRPAMISSFNFLYPMLSHSLSNVPDDCFLETACFTLVFNLAICYHKHSISTNTPPTAAVQLYELAFQTATSNKCIVPLVYLCALMNNAAQVQRKLGNLEGSQKQLVTLLGFLPYCVDVHHQRMDDSRGVDQQSINLLNEFLPAFFGAVSHLILEELHTADAA